MTTSGGSTVWSISMALKTAWCQLAAEMDGRPVEWQDAHTDSIRLPHDRGVHRTSVEELIGQLVGQGAEVAEDADEEADVEHESILVWLPVLEAQKMGELLAVFLQGF
ncbi:unnamed protein product [Clonostachys rosea]|uniref:Uncharacterized protein n=1 Tax=Bionectria ochroleuca TaxID=29856 RepID=A0ABY6UL81_BIOOC|nr:unnamed protein product [Clonostachys rosea]